MAISTGVQTLSAEAVEALSASKHEPTWMRDRRLAAWQTSQELLADRVGQADHGLGVEQAQADGQGEVGAEDPAQLSPESAALLAALPSAASTSTASPRACRLSDSRPTTRASTSPSWG